MSDKCSTRLTKMTMSEFLSECTAHGGNWTAMIMSGIRNLSKKDCRFKDLYNQMPDKEYEFVEVLELIKPYVNTGESKKH